MGQLKGLVGDAGITRMVTNNGYYVTLKQANFRLKPLPWKPSDEVVLRVRLASHRNTAELMAKSIWGKYFLLLSWNGETRLWSGTEVENAKLAAVLNGWIDYGKENGAITDNDVRACVLLALPADGNEMDAMATLQRVITRDDISGVGDGNKARKAGGASKKKVTWAKASSNSRIDAFFIPSRQMPKPNGIVNPPPIVSPEDTPLLAGGIVSLEDPLLSASGMSRDDGIHQDILEALSDLAAKVDVENRQLRKALEAEGRRILLFEERLQSVERALRAANAAAPDVITVDFFSGFVFFSC